MSAIYRTDVLWDEWYDQQATSDEKEIYDLIWQHKHLFDDLTLQKGSSTFSIFEDNDRPVLQCQPVEKVRRKLGFFAFMWYNIGEGS